MRRASTHASSLVSTASPSVVVVVRAAGVVGLEISSIIIIGDEVRAL